MSVTGTLVGIGVGPGDPDLITVKGLTALQAAPVIAYPAPETGESLARAIVAPHLDGASRRSRSRFACRWWRNAVSGPGGL